MEDEKTPLLGSRRPQTFRLYSLRPTWTRVLAATGFVSLVVLVTLQVCRANIPTVIDHDFGVGFDLTSQYG